MRRKKAAPKTLVAVRIDPALDRAIEDRCKREGIMKMDFCALAFRRLLMHGDQVKSDA